MSVRRGAVADPVERHSRNSRRLLDPEAIGDVVGGDEIERALSETGPQRLDVGRGAQGRRDDAAGAADRIGVVVAGVGQDQVVRARLGAGADADGLGPANLVERRSR
jgi:hypothetical protein